MEPREKEASGAEGTERLRRERDRALDSARAAIRDTTRVTRLLTVLNEPAEIDVLLDNILSTISELFSADIAVLLDPAGTGNFMPLASVGLPEDASRTLAFEFDYASAFSAAREGTIQSHNAIREENAPGDELLGLGARTAVWIPLTGSQELRGALALARCHPAPFSKEDIDLLCAMTYRIGLTLEQAQRKAQLERIVKNSREMGRRIDARSLLKQAVEDIPSLTGGDASALFRPKADGRLVCAARSGGYAARAREWRPLAEFLAADAALARGETRRVTDILSAVPALAAMSPPFAYRAILAVPVFHDVRLQGIVCVFRENSVDFTPDMGQIVSLYSGQLGTEIESARLYQALRDELRERERIEASLRKSEERFKALVHNVSDVIVVLDEDGGLRYVSDAASKAWNTDPARLIGRPLLDRIHPDDETSVRGLIAKARGKPKESLSAVVRLREGDTGSYRYFDAILTNLLADTAVQGIVSIFHDITESKLYEKELSEMAFRDPLTLLANRTYFSERVRIALVRAVEGATAAILIFIDLDNFKSVNDSLGHAAGDATLRAVAERIRGCLRNNDLAARLGGDEFAILIEGAQNSEQLTPLLERLLSSIKAPVRINGSEVAIGCSIGVATSGQESEGIESLLAKADSAMYAAKRLGKGRYVFYR